MPHQISISSVRQMSRFLLFAMLAAWIVVSCSPKMVSPDGLLKAVKVRENGSVHYQVIEISTGRVVFTTHAQADTPNDVKEGVFSEDSKQFAASYHYGHDGTFTWIGVWSTETGDFISSITRPGWEVGADWAFYELAANNVQPEQSFMRGIVYTSWLSGEYSDPQSDATLSQRIKPVGVNWVSLLVTCYQETTESPLIQCENNGQTPTDADLIHSIQYIHNLGLQVMLKPHIDLSNDPLHWRGEIGFGDNEEAWQAWFEQYTQFITHYAELAQKEKADYFVIGTELKGTSHRSTNWQAVIREVRSVYDGPIIYAANWDEYDEIAWWGDLDAVGIDAYFPLTQNNDPTIAELTAGWSPIATELEAFAAEWERPIIFTEIGYRSLDGTNQAPSNFQNSGNIDLQEQADCYQAVFDALGDETWWQGVFWWNWTTNPNQGGPNDNGYTANNKPAENVLRHAYGAPSRTDSAPASEPAPGETVESEITSSDGLYGVRSVSVSGVHYQVFEISNDRLILTTNAKYETPNDVKAGGFSADNRRFAAVYHYGDQGDYTWIGVWSVETGQLLYTVEKAGWTTDLSGVFDGQP
jgi:hypothetical protein